ncbi:MAG: HlyC/CorC family transporter [Deltaproteobacteria bacterium]|nr:HlyC/CorC family transporter [Deltaproteobacteria bacterium]
MIIAAYFAVFLLLLLLEGFFTSSEIALVSADHRKLKHLAAEGHRGARLAEKLLRFPEKLFATTLLGSNLAETVNTVLVTAILIDMYGAFGELAAMLLLPPVIILFAEILPKSIARTRPTRMAQRVGFFVWLASWILSPITWIFASLSRLVLWLTGSRGASLVPFVTREELQMVVKAGGADVDLATEERTIIHRILHFSQTMVREAMVPLIEVAAVPETYLVSQALDAFRRGRFSRLPVYRQRIDNIIGVLDSFDLLGEKNTAQSIGRFVHPVRYAPETMRADQLLVEMQQMGTHLVVAVDEYGGAVGIVTLEDLLEEIVGEIADEFDKDDKQFRKMREGIYLINARMEIEDLNEKLDLNLPLGHYHTLGGFLIAQSGDIPAIGRRIRYQNLLFIIRQADLRAVKEVEVHVEGASANN